MSPFNTIFHTSSGVNLPGLRCTRNPIVCFGSATFHFPAERLYFSANVSKSSIVESLSAVAPERISASSTSITTPSYDLVSRYTTETFQMPLRKIRVCRPFSPSDPGFFGNMSTTSLAGRIAPGAPRVSMSSSSRSRKSPEGCRTSNSNPSTSSRYTSNSSSISSNHISFSRLVRSEKNSIEDSLPRKRLHRSSYSRIVSRSFVFGGTIAEWTFNTASFDCVFVPRIISPGRAPVTRTGRFATSASALFRGPENFGTFGKRCFAARELYNPLIPEYFSTRSRYFSIVIVSVPCASAVEVRQPCRFRNTPASVGAEPRSCSSDIAYNRKCLTDESPDFYIGQVIYFTFLEMQYVCACAH